MEIEKIIKEQLEKLPLEIVSLFFDQEFQKKIAGVGQKNNLNESQIEILQTETSLLIIGLTHPGDFSEELKNQLALNEEAINNLCNDIENILPLGIIEKLNELFEKDKEIITDEITLDHRFDKLPQIVKDAINQSGWKEKLYEITAKYKISIENMGLIEESTVNLLLNNIDAAKFEQEIKALGMGQEDATNLINDINENIIKTIREIMRAGKITEDEEAVPLPPYKKTTEARPMEAPSTLTPPKEESKPNIIQEKLEKPIASEHKVSDYSIPKTSFDINKEDIKPSIPHDPYREII